MELHQVGTLCPCSLLCFLHELSCIFFTTQWYCPCAVAPLLCYALVVSKPCSASSLLLKAAVSSRVQVLSHVAFRCALVASMSCVWLCPCRVPPILCYAMVVSIPCPASFLLRADRVHALSRLVFATQWLRPCRVPPILCYVLVVSMPCPAFLLRRGCPYPVPPRL